MAMTKKKRQLHRKLVYDLNYTINKFMADLILK